MNILVYGAGVLGSLYAARLFKAGHNVTILARGERLEAIREQGIVLEDLESGVRSTVPVPVVGQLAPDDSYRYVLVLVRKSQVASVLPALAANPHTPNILFMTNNAAGPDEMIAALGRERVMLGFPGAGGTRDGQVVRCHVVSRRSQPTTLGELDGRRSTRVEQIARALEMSGFPVAISPDMDAWLKTHVALVSPGANALYLASGDNYRLARTRDGLVLYARAVKEGFRVLEALNIPIIPKRYEVLDRLPEPLLVMLLRRILATERAEVLMAAHANAARDEMQQLGDEFRALARRTSVPTPAIDRLATYLDPRVPPLPEGSNQLALDWQPLWAMGGALAGTLAALALLYRRERLAPWGSMVGGLLGGVLGARLGAPEGSLASPAWLRPIERQRGIRMTH
jgi:2-dehydropantoate 2-reductase